jgi:cytoplasmic iron level regulating protein YaaA (DUF328/UPF0246 family)
MLVLLPPSEGKRAPADGAPIDLDALAFPQLRPARERTLAALVRLAGGNRKKALTALGLTPNQAAALDLDAALETAPAAPAGEVYTGVLYQHLDLPSLSAAALARGCEHVLVASALWGVVALDDRIPAYRLSMNARLPALRTPGLAAWWRPRLTKALPDEHGALVVDLRSGPYAAAWRPKAATTVEVKASTHDGKPISHMAKAVRGTVARRLLQARRPPRTPTEVANLADDGAGHVILHEPARRGGTWTVEVIAPPPAQQ